MVRDSNWYCVNEACGKVLGTVMGGELTPADKIPAKNMQTRGPNLVLICPDCGTPKVWYTSDPIVRATYQLVEAITTVMAKRMLATMSGATVGDSHEEKRS